MLLFAQPCRPHPRPHPRPVAAAAAPRWTPSGRCACLRLVASLAALCGQPPAQAAHVPVPEEAAARLAAEVAADGKIISAPWAAAGLSPEHLMSLRDIDLLLDVQLADTDLGRTPADAAATAPQQAAVDVRSLSPGVPANPVFPGYGLSYEPPSVAARPMLPDSVRTAADPDGLAPSRPWSHQGGAGLGLDWREGSTNEPLRKAAEWLSDNRVSLLLGLGLAVVLGAALVGMLRRAAAPARPVSASSSRRRRRSGGHASSAQQR